MFLRKNRKRKIATFRVQIRLFTLQIGSFAKLPLPSPFRENTPSGNAILLCINNDLKKYHNTIGLQFRK